MKSFLPRESYQTSAHLQYNGDTEGQFTEKDREGDRAHPSSQTKKGYAVVRKKELPTVWFWGGGGHELYDKNLHHNASTHLQKHTCPQISAMHCHCPQMKG